MKLNSSYSVDSFHAVVERAADTITATLGAELLNVTLLGSLAHGGVSARFSDIDIAVLLRTPQDPARMQALWTELHSAAPQALSRRISLFWTGPRLDWGRMRPVDQVDLCDNGEVLRGTPVSDLPRPSLAAVRQDMAAHSLPYWAAKTRRFATQEPENEAEFKELVRCVLYPARLWVTWQEGRVVGNNEAVAYLVSHPIEGVSLGPIRDALSCREGRVSDEQLLLHRETLQEQRKAVLSRLGLDQI